MLDIAQHLSAPSMFRLSSPHLLLPNPSINPHKIPIPLHKRTRHPLPPKTTPSRHIKRPQPSEMHNRRLHNMNQHHRPKHHRLDLPQKRGNTRAPPPKRLDKSRRSLERQIRPLEKRQISECAHEHHDPRESPRRKIALQAYFLPAECTSAFFIHGCNALARLAPGGERWVEYYCVGVVVVWLGCSFCGSFAGVCADEHVRERDVEEAGVSGGEGGEAVVVA